VTSALVAAVASTNRVRLPYRSESGSGWPEEVDQWAVVVRHGRWYLLCHSHYAGAVSYRVDRVLTVENTRHPFTPPTGLDPVRALEDFRGGCRLSEVSKIGAVVEVGSEGGMAAPSYFPGQRRVR
jgi:predicted DNA-binding transcriptional regulator YafY